MTNVKFSPTQQAIIEVLADGLPHKRQELLDCFDDPLITNIHLNVMLCQLRKKLRPLGWCIDCVLIQGRQIGYKRNSINTGDPFADLFNE